ncbi:MAG: Ca-activated chloride channel [Blastocatellia bacterium]|nr:Ca-activated chloride channel [Blastocatellia bacterium]
MGSGRIRPLLAILILFGMAASFLLASPGSLKVSAQEQDDEVIRVNTDLVLVNVTVTDVQGQFVGGLKRTDFTLLEDGQPQTLFSFSSEETPFAAAVLLDTSGSMEKRLSLGRSAAIRFLDGLRSEDVASIYRFDTSVNRLQDFSSGRDLPPSVYSAQTRGMTVLNDAVLRAAEDLSKRPEKRRAVIVLSDGGENGSNSSSSKALERALSAGATIYAVNMSVNDGARDLRGAGVLRNYAEKSGGLYIPTPGGQELRDSFATILAELGHQYTLAYRSSNRARDGSWRAIEVKVPRPGITVRTRKGYRAPK